jgi:hypothetical protein
MHLTIGVGKERVLVSDDGGALLVRCSCALPDCPHVIAIELGDRSTVNPKEADDLVAANTIIGRHVDLMVQLARRLIRIRNYPARKHEVEALEKAIADRLIGVT